jgi:hypothetical protein
MRSWTLTLCFLALLAVADATVIKSIMGNKESNAGRLLREGQFEKYKELRAANRDSKFGKRAGKLASGKQPLTVDSDITYTGKWFFVYRVLKTAGNLIILRNFWNSKMRQKMLQI